MAAPRRKACIECRQQKIRCDVEQHRTPHNPCGRCEKMGLECRILPTSTRNLRQTKAEMRRELEELRWNMRQNSGDPKHAHSAESSVVDGKAHTSRDNTSGTYSEPSGRTEGSDSPSPAFESRPPTRKSSSQRATLPRIVDNYLLDPEKIDDCFKLFFSQYHPLFPILDISLKPNDYFELSPFLFWAIVVTGSRRYSRDSMVLDRTSKAIIPLAFSSMALRSSQIPVIQGLLILCTWRLPTNSMYKDMTYLMCGSAVHLATQIGLHISGVGQDFARMPVKKDQDLKFNRAKLWLCCVIVSIRTSCGEGIPPLAESFLGDDQDPEDMVPHLPTDLQFLHKVYIILLRAMIAMGRTNLQSFDCDVRVLRSCIGIFDSQLLGLASSSRSDLDTLQLDCARIHVMAFHFFAPSSRLDAEGLSRFYSFCISVIQKATTKMTSQTFPAFISQSFIDRTITLAGFSILRLCHSPLAQHLDLEAGKQAYFKAIHFLKSISLQQGDIRIRTALIMRDLWGSDRIFRRKDGSTDSLCLRLRTRLSMSVSYDMFWYWREEFGNVRNPYNGEDAVPSNDATQPNTPPYTSRPLPEIPDDITDRVQTRNSKLDATFVNHLVQPHPPVLNFDAWNGSHYYTQPMPDQFPDYDWASGFAFSDTNFPAIPIDSVNPTIPGMALNMGYPIS